MTEFLAIPSITVICWFIGLCIKTVGTSELADRLIPVICGIMGGLLGVFIFFCYPSIIPCNDILSAIATGIVSGLSATGVNEAVKQFTNK